MVAGAAEQLPASHGAFDAAVVWLVLCSVADPAVALAEAYRVLRPGGQLRVLRARPRRPVLGGVQRLADATLWPRLAGGCLAGRDTLATIERAGFALQPMTRLRFPDSRVTLPTSPHVLGTASRMARLRGCRLGRPGTRAAAGCWRGSLGPGEGAGGGPDRHNAGAGSTWSSWWWVRCWWATWWGRSGRGGGCWGWSAFRRCCWAGGPGDPRTARWQGPP
jgi:SAM-dependent methyltransferase